MRYNKPAISIADQIQLLETRGLLINDQAEAEHFLSQLSYSKIWNRSLFQTMGFTPDWNQQSLWR